MDADVIAVVRRLALERLAGPEAKRRLVAMGADVDHALSSLALDLGRPGVSKRAQQGAVELEAALEVGDDQIEVVDAAAH